MRKKLKLPVDLWRKQKGKYFFLSTKSATGKWKDYPIERGDWGKAGEIIRNNRDKDIYMCPHGFSAPYRKKEFSMDPKLLYADLDEADPQSLAIKPTIAIESSPGRHVGYWVVDRAADEDLNRRLSYSIGADVSGWDRTQVLRVPGTRNYKYHDTPRVKEMWQDGPTYSLSAIEKMVPEIEGKGGEVVNELADQVYAKYEKRLKPWVRKALLNDKPIAGKRSEVLWKMTNEMVETGMTRAEIFALQWASPWNKFRERRDGSKVLIDQIDKAISSRFSGVSVRPPEKEKHVFLARSMAEVEVENIDWLVPGMFARGEITIVEGDPGDGKSYMMQVIAKHLCDGDRLPFVEKRTKLSRKKVAYLDVENSVGTITKARLEDNGMIHFENYYQETIPISVDDEESWDKLIERLLELGFDMIVFDPISVYIGGSDSYKAAEVTQVMSLFKEIAIRCNASVVAVRHLTKGGKDKALYRGQGSIAFTGSARIVMTVGRHPEDRDIRVVTSTKNNLSAPFKSFTYTIKSLPDTLKRTNRSELEWLELCDLTSDDVVQGSNQSIKGPTDKQIATDFLKDFLSTNPGSEAAAIFRAAEGRGISRTTVNRAADELGIQKSSSGFGKNKKSHWELP